MTGITEAATITFRTTKYTPAPVYNELTPLVEQIAKLPADEMAEFDFATSEEAASFLNALQRAGTSTQWSVRKRSLTVDDAKLKNKTADAVTLGIAAVTRKEKKSTAS